MVRVFRIGDRIGKILFTQDDDTGDWTVMDIYFVDSKGEPAKLDRRCQWSRARAILNFLR